MPKIKNRTIIGSQLFFGALILSPLVLAQDAGIPKELAAIYACKSKTDSAERLACFDKAVGNFEVAERSGAVVTVDKAAIETVERDAFGFNIPSLPSLGRLFGGGKPRGGAAAVASPSAVPDSQSAKKTKKSRPTITAPQPSDVKEVVLTIEKTQKFGSNKTRLFMTNGQVWEQKDGAKLRIPKVRNNTPNTATITKASLGSFLLRINEKGSAIRVKRVR